MDQHRGNRRIDAAGQGTDDTAGADLVADPADRLVAVGAHRPVAGEPRDPQEIAVERAAVGRVMHFGVELHGVEPPFRVGHDGKRRTGRFGRDGEPGGEAGDVVAVRHPDLFAPLEEPAGQQVRRLVRGGDVGAPELCRPVAAQDLPAQHLHHHLLAVADAQDRHAQVEHGRRRPGRGSVDHTRRTARQDHRQGSEVRKKRVRHHVERMDFAIDVQLAQPPRDELGDLAAKVDDEQALM